VSEKICTTATAVSWATNAMYLLYKEVRRSNYDIHHNSTKTALTVVVSISQLDDRVGAFRWGRSCTRPCLRELAATSSGNDESRV